tara:strand:- start:7257 stop:8114 length:858 start_codon:yes stop_codon:yes gene_type:complete
MIPQTDNRNSNIKYGLYVISTPIGNLGDISFRAIEILKKSNYILCEDTRVSKKLLDRYSIHSKLVSYHKFNEKKNLAKIISSLKSEETVALISDAGTPAISDPGAILIKECIKENIDIFPIPGPSSVTAAISISGFSSQYYFYGFFPEKGKDIKDDLKVLSSLNCSIIFFISPKKINKAIKQIKLFFLDRDILICREITKFYEEFIRTNVKTLKLFEKVPKGELTIVLSSKKGNINTSKNLSESDKKLIEQMIKTTSIKDIVKFVSEYKDLSKKEIYNYCLKLKR